MSAFNAIQYKVNAKLLRWVYLLPNLPSHKFKKCCRLNFFQKSVGAPHFLEDKSTVQRIPMKYNKKRKLDIIRNGMLSNYMLYSHREYKPIQLSRMT